MSERNSEEDKMRERERETDKRIEHTKRGKRIYNQLIGIFSDATINAYFSRNDRKADGQTRRALHDS